MFSNEFAGSGINHKEQRGFYVIRDSYLRADLFVLFAKNSSKFTFCYT